MPGIVRTNYDYKLVVVSGHKNEIKMLTSQNCYLKIVWQGEWMPYIQKLKRGNG